ncbi:MFS transporter [Paraburkholderia strydomiana]
MPPLSRGYTTLAVLIVAYIISLVDRQVMSLMVAPIKQTLHINDVEIGLLQGFSFALFYCILGLPLGRIADRSSRRILIAAGMAFWSAATIACAFAHSFTELFVARMCVGIGEAALAPAAYSLLADLFPPKRLIRANALFSMGAMLGGGLALVVGGTAHRLRGEVRGSVVRRAVPGMATGVHRGWSARGPAHRRVARAREGAEASGRHAGSLHP